MSPIVRPDTNTPFHVDMEWFDTNGRDLRSEMYGALCEECRVLYPSPADARPVDRINPTTGEISKVDALWECIADHCGLKPTYIPPTMPLTTAIFRALLANGNQPMTSEQLYKRIGKSNPQSILRLLLGAEIENGVVPANGRKP
jgi:hypothetical protein